MPRLATLQLKNPFGFIRYWIRVMLCSDFSNWFLEYFLRMGNIEFSVKIPRRKGVWKYHFFLFSCLFIVTRLICLMLQSFFFRERVLRLISRRNVFEHISRKSVFKFIPEKMCSILFAKEGF